MSVQCIHTMYTFGVTDLDSWCQHAIAFWVWESMSSNYNQPFGHVESQAWQTGHPHCLRASKVDAHLLLKGVIGFVVFAAAVWLIAGYESTINTHNLSKLSKLCIISAAILGFGKAD